MPITINIPIPSNYEKMIHEEKREKRKEQPMVSIVS